MLNFRTTSKDDCFETIPKSKRGMTSWDTYRLIALQMDPVLASYILKEMNIEIKFPLRPPQLLFKVSKTNCI